MALTAIEQLDLMNGILKPPSAQLNVLVHQTAFIYSKNWYDNVKDVTSSVEGAAYADKMFSVAKKVFTNDPNVVSILHRIISTLIGASSNTYAVVQSADDTGWSSFVLDNMDEAFEYLSDVREN